VPLSEDEQRILQDIERSFYENDPAFARAVTEGTLSRHAGRNCKLAGAGFAFSFIFMLVTFTHILLLGFLGFAGMVLCATLFVHNLRKISRTIGQANEDGVPQSVVEQWFERLRDRLRGE